MLEHRQKERPRWIVMKPEDSELLKRTWLPDGLKAVDLEFIGSGSQGEVYRIDHNRCIKVYTAKKYFHRELANLKKGDGDPLLPQVYEWGKYYIIREYIDGISLSSYFKMGRPLTPQISMNLVDLWETFKRLGYRRCDTRLSHVYIINPAGALKIIDPTNVMNNKRSFPRKMFSGLERYGVKATFLDHVRELRPDVYRQWKKYLGEWKNHKLTDCPKGIKTPGSKAQGF